MALIDIKTIFVFCFLLTSLQINCKSLSKQDVYPDPNLKDHDFIENFWTILHTFAAAYPKDPCILKKESFVGFLYSFKFLLPDQVFRGHYKNIVENYNLKFGNRDEAVMSVCEMHNEYNKLANLELIDCSKAFDFWGGGCGCGAKEEDETEIAE